MSVSVAYRATCSTGSSTYDVLTYLDNLRMYEYWVCCSGTGAPLLHSSNLLFSTKNCPPITDSAASWRRASILHGDANRRFQNDLASSISFDGLATRSSHASLVTGNTRIAWEIARGMLHCPPVTELPYFRGGELILPSHHHEPHPTLFSSVIPSLLQSRSRSRNRGSVVRPPALCRRSE